MQNPAMFRNPGHWVLAASELHIKEQVSPLCSSSQGGFYEADQAIVINSRN